MLKNLFAWASIGSNGKVISDIAGDPNGREVKIGKYYDFGQNGLFVSVQRTWTQGGNSG